MSNFTGLTREALEEVQLKAEAINRELAVTRTAIANFMNAYRSTQINVTTSDDAPRELSVDLLLALAAC